MRIWIFGAVLTVMAALLLTGVFAAFPYDVKIMSDTPGAMTVSTPADNVVMEYTGYSGAMVYTNAEGQVMLPTTDELSSQQYPDIVGYSLYDEQQPALLDVFGNKSLDISVNGTPIDENKLLSIDVVNDVGMTHTTGDDVVILLSK